MRVEISYVSFCGSRKNEKPLIFGWPPVSQNSPSSSLCAPGDEEKEREREERAGEGGLRWLIKREE